MDSPHDRTHGVLGVPWPVVLAEVAGTALLLAIGLSFVIMDFGRGGPVAALITGGGPRRALTGFLFGTTGALIAVSPLGKLSGAHINPVVSMAFWLRGVMTGTHMLVYMLAQCLGAILGALPLLLWRDIGSSVMFGATTPGPAYGAGIALAGEVAASAALVAGLFLFLGHRPARAFTPLLFPFLYAFMVWLEAPLSGTSTNPARSLGPAVVSGHWGGFWVYVLGPAIGAALAARLHATRWFRHFRVEVAKVYHYEEDAYGIFKQTRDSAQAKRRSSRG